MNDPAISWRAPTLKHPARFVARSPRPVGSLWKLPPSLTCSSADIHNRSLQRGHDPIPTTTEVQFSHHLLKQLVVRAQQAVRQNPLAKRHELAVPVIGDGPSATKRPTRPSSWRDRRRRFGGSVIGRRLQRIPLIAASTALSTLVISASGLRNQSVDQMR